MINKILLRLCIWLIYRKVVMHQHFQKFIELLICTDVAERDLRNSFFRFLAIGAPFIVPVSYPNLRDRPRHDRGRFSFAAAFCGACCRKRNLDAEANFFAEFHSACYT